MGTTMAAVAQLINCLNDCVDMPDFMNRRETAGRVFVRQREAGFVCLGPFRADAVDFPVYAPLIFTSFDALMGGDLGLLPAFFGHVLEPVRTVCT